jgi:TonB family protein
MRPDLAVGPRYDARMRVCSTVNAAAGFAFVILLSFAGCSGNKSAPGAAAPTPGASSEPTGAAAGGTDKADDTGDESGDDKSGDDKSGDDKSGDDKSDDQNETRTTEVIQKVVEENRKSVRACYDKVRKQVPDLAGTLTIHFVLDPEGKVKSAEVNLERSEIKSAEVSKCAIDAIKKMKFPPSSRGMESKINYPFNFKPDGGGSK